MDKRTAVCSSVWALSIILTNNSSQQSIGEKKQNKISSFVGTINIPNVQNCGIMNDELVHFKMCELNFEVIQVESELFQHCIRTCSRHSMVKYVFADFFFC